LTVWANRFTISFSVQQALFDNNNGSYGEEILGAANHLGGPGARARWIGVKNDEKKKKEKETENVEERGKMKYATARWALVKRCIPFSTKFWSTNATSAGGIIHMMGCV
jgi:hypothetical protein